MLRARLLRPAAWPSVALLVAAMLIAAAPAAPAAATAGIESGSLALAVELSTVPTRTVRGHVRDESGAPVAGAWVAVLDLDLDPAVTGADGAYVIPGVPEGEWYVRADRVRCRWSAMRWVTVAGDTIVDLVMDAKKDEYGHTCAAEPAGWVDVGVDIGLSGDTGVAKVDLPFPVNLYEQSYRSLYVYADGFISVNSLSLAGPTWGDASSAPSGAVYAMAADLVIPADGRVRAGTVGVAPHRAFVVTWENVTLSDRSDLRVSFQVVLAESGRIAVQYRGLDELAEAGEAVSVGINALDYGGIWDALTGPNLDDDIAVVFQVPGSRFVNGVVTDANDRLPVRYATVTAGQRGAPDRTVQTDADGWFQVRLRPGAARLKVTADAYVSATARVRVPAAQPIVRRDAVLRTARLTASASGLDVVLRPGQSRRRTVTIGNTGGVPAGWSVREVGDGRLPDAPAGNLGGAAAGAGRVIRSWSPAGMSIAWGLGYADGVWVSGLDGPGIVRFTDDGTRDRVWNLGPLEVLRDMAFVADRGWMCQLAVPTGGLTSIICWDPATGAVTATIEGADLPWSEQPQVGLAYRPDDDSFYVAGAIDGIVYHVKGLSYPDPGAVIGQCQPGEAAISGLAWNRTHRLLWMTSQTYTDMIDLLDPDTCETIRSVAPPDTEPSTGAGLDTDPLGHLWLVSMGFPGTVYEIDAGLPESNDVPWLRASPGRGRLVPGDQATVTVTLDATKLEPGVYGAYVVLVSNSGRQPEIVVPVRLEVSG